MAVSQNDGSIILNTKVDTSGLNSGLTSIKKTITNIGAAIGVTFGIRALVMFGKQAMTLASDLEEVQNVVDVAFGEMVYKMENFADTAIETFGISKLTAKQTGSSFMAMAKGMGIADEAASDMALTLTGLSADMASFYNIRQEEAKTALSAVYTGETETLKRYGILITEVNLQEYARQQGIEKSIAAMTQEEKVMLRYNYVLNATQLAQGDFERTQDSFANKTRVLTEKWKEMQSVFGETLIILADGLMPVLEQAVERLTIVALYIAAFAKGMTSANEETMGLSQQTEDYTETAKSATKAVNGVTQAVEELGDETKGASKDLAAFDEAMILQTAGGGISDSFSELFPAGFSQNLKSLNEFLGGETLENIENFQRWVSENKGAIKTALEIGGIVALAGVVGNLLSKLGLLPNAFRKKDKGLDTQTPKVQAEAQAVGSLSTAVSVLATTLLAKYIPAFAKSAETQEAWASSVAGSSAVAANALGTSTYEATNSAIENVETMTTQTGSAVASWATGVAESTTESFSTMAENIKTSLQDSFNNIQEFVRATKDAETVENGSVNLYVSPFKRIRAKNAWDSFWQTLSNASPFKKMNGWSLGLSVLGGLAGVPALAQGAVIPPNREFLAVLGDQRQGTNIEAPLQTIVDAFNLALAQNGGYNGGNTEVVLELNGRELGRAVVEQGNKENRRIGTRLVIA